MIKAKTMALKQPAHEITLTWIPGRQVIGGNAASHEAAREVARELPYSRIFGPSTRHVFYGTSNTQIQSETIFGGEDEADPLHDDKQRPSQVIKCGYWVCNKIPHEDDSRPPGFSRWATIRVPTIRTGLHAQRLPFIDASDLKHRTALK